jgi:Asp-tRNA(Asn)/Glu-tRNA(Gln) amidotransferase A subunit family amidase
MNAECSPVSSTTQLLEDVRVGRRRVSDVADATSKRIIELDAKIQAFVRYEPPLVAARAEQLDVRAVRGPLHGRPVGVKDLIDTQDEDTGCGSPIYPRHRPAEDAEIVAQLREAGSLIVG